MGRRATRVFALTTFLLALDGAHGAGPVSLVREIRTLREGGGRVDWNHARDLIAFDMLGQDDFYDVWVMRPDGSGQKCLTENHPDLPNRHIAQPAWHPSGDYLVFQAEKAEHPQTWLQRVVEPGAGVYNDLWVLVLATHRAYPLRVVPAERGNGVLHAHFSEDGKRLSWSEMYEPGSLRGERNLLGLWKLQVAEFVVEDDKPRLDGVRAYQPGEPAFYENHGFSPDGTKLLFTSNFEAVSRLNSHIYTLDLETEQLTRLTDGEEWNEHASYSPDGRRIVWMSRNANGKGTDYWVMNSDGSDKRPLTHFNESGHAHSSGEEVVVADFSWSPDGTRIAAYKRMGGGLESKDSRREVVILSLDPATFASGAGTQELSP